MRDKYESVFKCQWCGDVDLQDDSVEEMVDGDILPGCPKCKRFSYANTIRAKFKVDASKWRGCFGSI